MRTCACSAKKAEHGRIPPAKGIVWGLAPRNTQHGIDVSKEVLQSMAKLSAELMAVLRCPVTASPLEEVDGALVSTAADAAGHHIRYVLEEGIPVLLAPSATRASDPVPDTLS